MHKLVIGVDLGWGPGVGGDGVGGDGVGGVVPGVNLRIQIFGRAETPCGGGDAPTHF